MSKMKVEVIPCSASTIPVPISLITVGSEPKIPEPMIAPIPVPIQPRRPIFFFVFVSTFFLLVLPGI